MTKALLDLLSSKKFLVFAATAIVAAAARLGYDADTELVAMILGFGAVLIGGYAAQDRGKAAARIVAETQPDDADKDSTT